MKPWPRNKTFLQRWMNRKFLKEYPRLTIITPSYNQGQFLEETILSVLNQDYPNLEYIVIDGGSTDSSVEIIKKYEHRLAYWVSEKDKGQADAINKGLRMATGEIVGWLNSDDKYVVGAFDKIEKAFKDNPTCLLVHGDRILIDENSLVYGFGNSVSFDPKTSGFNVCSETAFWRIDARTRNMFLNPNLNFAIDLELFSRMYKVGEFIKLSVYIGYFRAHSASKSTTIWDTAIKESDREWARIFGSNTGSWNIKHVEKGFKLSLFLKLISNPLLVAVPYFYRRFILRKRGLDD